MILYPSLYHLIYPSLLTTSLLTNCEAISKDIDEWSLELFKHALSHVRYIFTRVAEYDKSKARNKSMSDYITW